MTSKLKLLPLAIISIAALAFAACSGGSSDPTPAPTEAVVATVHPDEQLFVLNGTEVLGKSAATFSGAEVTSFTGETHFSFTLGTYNLKQNSDFASEAPDKMYVEQSFEGGDLLNTVDLFDGGTMKMLARDGVFYMETSDGWMSFTPDDLGATDEEMQDMIDWGTLFDYQGFLEKRTENVTFIANEDVNGHATARYKYQGSLSDLFASFSEAFGAVGDYGFTQYFVESGVEGPITIDLWVGKDDYLPYKLAMTASGNTPYGHLELTADAAFDNYNQPAPIPDAPADAVSFADYFADLFEDIADEPTPAE
jgi:hypothetical protein